jgi:hypothetical protein
LAALTAVFLARSCSRYHVQAPSKRLTNRCSQPLAVVLRKLRVEE